MNLEWPNSAGTPWSVRAIGNRQIKTAPEAVSFCSTGESPCLGRVIALAALVRASGLR